MADFETFVQRILGFKRTGEIGKQKTSEAPTLLPGPDDPIFEGIPIANKLAAYKTITSMLAEIKRSTAVQIGDNLQSLQDSEERLQLKVSDAFGQLAVGQHEIVAVTTTIAERLFKVVVTKNYARDDKDPLPPTPHPIILHPLEPDDLQGWSAFDYMIAYTKNSANYW
jgi:hypothetical protein